jgi:hypothetical protein
LGVFTRKNYNTAPVVAKEISSRRHLQFFAVMFHIPYTKELFSENRKKSLSSDLMTEADKNAASDGYP